ncbi:periplasmic heavy metal sensor [Maricaulis sp.]|uniref:periplasmic heavy metal sensor n=2 Tax=Maricaulis sp. TaxID=1486257 RepID=UPI003299E311
MKPSTPWIAALLVSVLANGVLAGFLLHRTTEGPDWRQAEDEDRGRGERRHHDSRRAGFDMRDMLFALPDDAREEARQRARDNIDEIRALFAQSRQAKEDFETAVRAETFDRDAAADALERLRTSREALELGLQGVMFDLLAEMDAETRIEVLDASRNRGRHDHGRSRPDREGSGPEGPRPE